MPEAGPPREIFGRQGRHSGGHFTGAPLLPPPFSISQNPAKDQALAALPPVVALYPKLYIPSTLNIDFIQWHTQLIVCAVKC